MSRLFLVIRRIEEAVLGVGILVIAAVTIANAASRTLWSQSLAFTEEIARFLIVFVTFFGLSYAAGRGRHIRMSALHDALGPRARKAVMVAIAAGTSLLMFVMAGYGLRYVSSLRAVGTTSPVLHVPLYLVYAAAPAGFFLAGVQYALAALRNLTADGVHLSWEVREEDETEASR